LLKVLRGDEIDWKAVEDKRAPKRTCARPCLSVRFKAEFGLKQWKNPEDPLCKVCAKRLEEQGTPYSCARCRQWFAKEAFADTYTRRDQSHRLCPGCVANHVRTCCKHNKDKPSADFTASMCQLRKSDRKCKECMSGRVCCICAKPQQESKFAAKEWSKPDEQLHASNAPGTAAAKWMKASCFFSCQQFRKDAADRTCCDCYRKRCSRCSRDKGLGLGGVARSAMPTMRCWCKERWNLEMRQQAMRCAETKVRVWQSYCNIRRQGGRSL
jgi:hypothetical protein